MRALLFPGQGSQRPGMGEGLFDRFPDWTAAAEAMLDLPLRALCLDGSAEDLRPTEICQPAMYVVNAMTQRARDEDGAPGADMLIGHSLGEYNALLAGGVFDFETGLRIVTKRGALMATGSENGLAAVLGLDRDEVQTVLDDSGLDDLWIANDNADTQQVIGGPNSAIAAAEELFYDNFAINYVSLPVSNAFHTPLLEPQAALFRQFLRGFTFSAPRIPVIANVTARPHSAEDLADTLSRHFHLPVRFAGSIRYARAQGVAEFEEIGDARVLSDLVRYIS